MSYLYICDRCAKVMAPNETTHRMSVEKITGQRSALIQKHICSECLADLQTFFAGDPVPTPLMWKQVPDERA